MAPGIGQILIVLLIVVLLFGASRVPAIAENLAKGIQSFKKGLKDDDGDGNTQATAISQKDAVEGEDAKEDKGGNAS